MKYLGMLILFLSFGCNPSGIKSGESPDKAELKNGELQIRIENKTTQDIDLVEIEGFVFENIAAGSTTGWILGKDITVFHIDEFYPTITRTDQTYFRNIGFCGTPPIASFQMEGTFKVIIEAFFEDTATFQMSQVEE